LIETHGQDTRATTPLEQFAQENKTFMDIAVSVNIGTVCQTAGKRLRVKVGRVTPCASAGESERARWQKSGGQRTARPTCPDVSISMWTAIVVRMGR